MRLLEKYTGQFSPDSVDVLKGKSPRAIKDDEVYIYLRNAILSGVFPPGYRLSETEIEDFGERVGAEKAMIREALVRLSTDHLVQYKADEGFTVSILELEDLREIYFLRSILEGAAGSLACNNLTQEELNKLESLCEQMEKSLRNNEIARLSLLNTDFHQTLYAAANSPRLYKMIVQLWNGFFHASLSFLADRAPLSVKEHRAIFESLKNREPEETEKIIKAHKIGRAPV